MITCTREDIFSNDTFWKMKINTTFDCRVWLTDKNRFGDFAMKPKVLTKVFHAWIVDIFIHSALYYYVIMRCPKLSSWKYKTSHFQNTRGFGEYKYSSPFCTKYKYKWSCGYHIVAKRMFKWYFIYIYDLIVWYHGSTW
jgi:hypothetical protein